MEFMIYKNLPSPLFSKEGHNGKINALDYAKSLKNNQG